MLKARLLGAVGIVAVVGEVLMAQTPPGPPETANAAEPAFEVASLRLNRPGDFQFLTESPLGQNRWTANQAGLVRLLVLAFDVKAPEMNKVVR